MVHMPDTREIILAIKRVRNEKGYSINDVVALIPEQDKISRSAVQRVLSDGSEDNAESFRYETTLRPIANALLGIEKDDPNDSPEEQAYKQILRYKMEAISDYKNEIQQEKEKYHKRLEEETAKYQKSLDFAMNQIALKDQRIDALLKMNNELMTTNNKLVNQLMNCPLKEKNNED